MRKLAIAMALASTAMAAPAVARDQSWYAGIEGGVMLVEDTEFDFAYDYDGIAGEIDNAFSVDHNSASMSTWSRVMISVASAPKPNSAGSTPASTTSRPTA